MGQTLLNRGDPEFDARIMCEGVEIDVEEMF
jgi:hypothetical protein